MKPEYDAFASDFSATRQRSWPEFAILLQDIKKGDRLLDLGCGNGRLRKFLDPEIVKPGDYFGADISQELLDIARKTYSKDHFFAFDFAKPFPFGCDQFDVVAAIASFHHLLSGGDQRHFLSECHRVMKKGGRLFITTWILPRKYAWGNLLRGRLWNWIIPFGPDRHPRTYRRVNLKTLIRLGKKAGFEVRDACTFEGRNHVVVLEKCQ